MIHHLTLELLFAQKAMGSDKFKAAEFENYVRTEKMARKDVCKCVMF